MTIHQFANQLKQEDGLSPLLQTLQALRRCSLQQLFQDDSRVLGWYPWDESLMTARQPIGS